MTTCVSVFPESAGPVKAKSEIDIAALIGRIGPEAAIVFRSRKAGPMADRRTRRNRSRSAQKRRAINED